MTFAEIIKKLEGPDPIDTKTADVILDLLVAVDNLIRNMEIDSHPTMPAFAIRNRDRRELLAIYYALDKENI